MTPPTPGDKRPFKINPKHYWQMYWRLKEISKYQSAESLKRHAERDYGVDGSEGIEMAYENVLATAKSGLKGVRKPPVRLEELT
ncbi:MAG: hypothetical protein KDA16_15080 [Phycisphaerales bacterium]|nr:hypothetical protein [Phycisphaerales bacterium]